ncbi:MAG: hypothetical protein VYB65_03580 [Myxococcota bacterium]|nr:hypothetical protein [Myxococcota bacterium]
MPRYLLLLTLTACGASQTPATDAGSAPTDASAAPADANAPAADAGLASPDAEQPVADASAPLADAAASPDAAGSASDAGSVAADAGEVEPGASLRPGVQEIIVEQRVAGELAMRRVVIQAPGRLVPAERYPVVFAFHGNGGRPEAFLGQLQRFVDAGRFVAILPEGLERSWNLGRERSQADDVAFVELIVERLRAYPNLNLNRAFAYGYSNGSGLVNQLAARTNLFRGYAMAASALTQELLPPEEVHLASVLSLHGTEDQACPYDGGRGVGGHDFLAVEDSAALWARKMGCSRFPISSRTDDGNRRLDWSPCREGHRVLHYGFQGAGHGLPMNQEGGVLNLVVSFFEETP